MTPLPKREELREKQEAGWKIKKLEKKQIGDERRKKLIAEAVKKNKSRCREKVEAEAESKEKK